MKIIYKIVLGLFLLISFASTAQQFKVVGYLGNWMGYTGMTNFARNFNYSRVTHINLAFKNPNSAGNLGAFLAEEDTLVKRAHQNGVKVLVSIAGGSISTTMINRYKTLMSDENRSAFVGKITRYVLDHNLDGLDVDLEGPAIDPTLYPLFIEELYDSLKQYDKLLTAALSQGYGGDNVSSSTLYFFDFVNIMAYDAVGTWSADPGGQHSTFDFASSNIVYWKLRGLPKNKCILGLPFYGYGFESDRGSYTYDYLVANYPEAPDEDTVGSYIYYNGKATIEAKTQLAMQQGGGVMIWELSQDTDDQSTSLLETIFETGILSNKEAILENSRVKIYPVPSTDNIFIETDLRSYNATLTTLEGSTILSGKNLKNLSVQDIPKGIYILNLTSDEGDLHKKIIVE